MQNLANMVEFGDKEPYMRDMNDFLREKFEMMRVRRRGCTRGRAGGWSAAAH